MRYEEHSPLCGIPGASQIASDIAAYRAGFSFRVTMLLPGGARTAIIVVECNPFPNVDLGRKTWFLTIYGPVDCGRSRTG
jgi:hypothetical protein